MDDRKPRDGGGPGPLERLVHAVLAWDLVPSTNARSAAAPREQDAVTVDRAKGAIMLRYGVNSHVAMAMLARWARDTQATTADVSRALVDGVVRSGRLPHDQHQVGEWLRARTMDSN
jgi:hypothetical protein